MVIPNGSDLNYNQANIDSPPKGKQRPIACYSWTTASGTVTPLMFKLKDEEGILQCFNKIRVVFSEKKIYCGIPSYEYNCDVLVNGILVNLTLQYYPETCKWFLLEKNK